MDVAFPEKFQCLFSPKRYKIFYGGRGGGKSWALGRALLIIGMQRQIRVLCVRQLQKSIADSVHKILKDQISKMGLEGEYDVQQAVIKNKRNGTEFAFEGIEQNVTKVKSYEGIDICWVEEADKVTKDSWDVLIPTIRKSGSEIWVCFNPNLEEDETYKRFVVDPPRESFVVKVSWRDNPFFPEELLAEMQEMKEKRYDDYLHIYEGNCKVVLDGAVYAEEIRDLLASERITSVPYDRSVGVDVYFDLGQRDKTAIWFYQYVAREHRVIDYYENTGKAIEHYIDLLQKKQYTYSTVNLPHDATHKTIVSKMSVEGIFKAKGWKTRVIPKLSLVEGINAVRTILPNCVFDKTKTQVGFRALRDYKYEIDEKTKLRSTKPKHDDSSHAADAFRYLAVGAGSPRRGPIESILGKLTTKRSDFIPDAHSGPSSGWMNQ